MSNLTNHFQSQASTYIGNQSLTNQRLVVQGFEWNAGLIRLFMSIAISIYGLSLSFNLEHYMAIVAPEYRFSFGEITPVEYLVCICAYALTASVMPKSIDRPSSLFLIVIHLLIYVPATVIIVGAAQPRGNDGFDWILLTILTVGFTLACLLVRRRLWHPGNRQSSRNLRFVLIALWFAAAGTLITIFGDIMQFASLNTIYAQREIGSAQSILEGYLQTYFGYVFSPALLAIGLNRRLILPIAMGVLGAFVLYMTTAEKAVLTYPFLMAGAWLAMERNYKWMVHVNFLAPAFALITLLATLYYKTIYAANFVAAYFVSRAIMIPGACIVYYSDYFGENGYTFWSHLRGFNLFISTPPSYAQNPRWPSLGLLVGEEYLGIRTLNANANFIASDGLASFGPVGIIISFVLFAIFLIYVDRLSCGLPRAFVIVALVPLALTFTNGSLFTLMTSFGGFLILLSLRYQFKTRQSDTELKRWHLL